MSRSVIWTLALLALPIAALPLSGQERGRGRGGPVTLPDGPGKEMVQAKCEACHGPGARHAAECGAQASHATSHRGADDASASFTANGKCH